MLPTRKYITDEKWADYKSRRVGETGVLRTLFGIVVLTVFAAAIIIPFIYMILMSLKGASEIGGNRLLPDAFQEFTQLGKHKQAWVRVQLSFEQAAAINNVERVPVAPMTPRTSMGVTTGTPANATLATKLSLEQPDIEEPMIQLLLEAEDQQKILTSRSSAAVYVPGAVEGSWTAVHGTIVPHNIITATGRLLTNYKTLLSLQTFAEGKLPAWMSQGYVRWYLNSLFVAFATVALGLFFDSLAAFAFAKYDFPFRGFLFAVLIATVMIPYPVILVPSFFIFAKLGLYNTYAALIVPGMVSAFGIFLVRQYMGTIPDDMLDAARVDGSTDFGVYRLIVLPIARPVLAALAVFRFVWQWNTYLFPLVLTNDDSMKTVQLGIATLQNAYGRVDYGVQMAGATLAVIPILVVYGFMQKHFIAGITMGSVKA